MKLIQPLFVTVLLVSFIFLKSKKTAIKKIFSRGGFTLLFAGYSFSIFFPDILQELANFLGVGRATDLVVYLTTLGFLIFGLIVFMKVKEIESRINKITRFLALMSSENSRIENLEKKKDE
jgi:hypothetical protein